MSLDDVTVDAAYEAAGSGDLPRLAELLDATPPLLELWHPARGSLLYWAAMYGDNARTRENRAAVALIEARLAALDLFAAAFLDRPSLAVALLAADPSAATATDAWGFTALHHAAECGAADVAPALGAWRRPRRTHAARPVAVRIGRREARNGRARVTPLDLARASRQAPIEALLLTFGAEME